MDAPELLLTQARSQLARQEAAVDTLRTRAVAVFSASGLAASIFGSHLPSHYHHCALITAAVSLVAGAVATVRTLWPRTMAFGEDLTDLLAWLSSAEGTVDRDEVATKALASHLNSLLNDNKGSHNSIANWFTVLVVAFALQVIAWCTALI